MQSETFIPDVTSVPPGRNRAGNNGEVVASLNIQTNYVSKPTNPRFFRAGEQEDS
jgi:hypothetical protein